MKTPREILIEQHRAATPKLDAARERAMATVETAKSPMPARAADSFFIKLWRELFWSCRRVWFTLAAIWIALLVINGVTDDSPRPAVASAVPPRDWKLTLQAQRKQLRELLESSEPPPPAPTTAPPRRSDLPAEAFFG